MPNSERFAFGSFVLERKQQRVLQQDGTQLNLTPRLFSALDLFITHAGELLDKDTLMRALWPGLVVEENNLSQVVAALRRALGDEAHESRFIQTVPRRGFRFVASVNAVPALAVPLSLPASPRRRRYLAAGIGLAVAGAAWWATRVPPPAPRRPIEQGGTRSLEAHELYVTAAWLSQSGRPDVIEKANALLHKALEIDPAFALAWTLLAWSHRRSLWSADTVPAEVFGPVNVALGHALALEPNLASARAGLGFSRYFFDFDWEGGEREFRSALAINPGEVSAHHGLAMMLVTQDRIDEGLAHIRIARELDPMAPVLCCVEASYLTHHGRLDQARVPLERVLDIAPHLWLAHAAHALLLFAEANDEAGIAALRRSVELGVGTTRPKSMLGFHLARTGQRDAAQAILSELVALSRKRYVPPVSIAAVQAALGDKAAALTSLELAIAVRDTRIIYLKDEPHWRSLRQEPRYAAMLKQLKLDRYGRGLTPV